MNFIRYVYEDGNNLNLSTIKTASFEQSLFKIGAIYYRRISICKSKGNKQRGLGVSKPICIFVKNDIP